MNSQLKVNAFPKVKKHLDVQLSADQAIRVDNVSMKFRLMDNRAFSLKEFVTRKVKGDINYKEFWALSDVSFSVKKGEVLGIVGRNGSGKSTLLKVISGILTPTKGDVVCNGTIAPMLELGSGFDNELTGRENVFLNGAILGFDKKFLQEKYDEIVSFAELERFHERACAQLLVGNDDEAGVFRGYAGQSRHTDCGRNSGCGGRKLSGKVQAAYAPTYGRRNNGAVCVPLHGTDTGNVQPCFVVGQRQGENAGRHANGVRRLQYLR